MVGALVSSEGSAVLMVAPAGLSRGGRELALDWNACDRSTGYPIIVAADPALRGGRGGGGSLPASFPGD